MRFNKFSLLLYAGILGLTIITSVVFHPTSASASYNRIYPNSTIGTSAVGIPGNVGTPSYSLAVGKDDKYVLDSAVNMRIYSTNPVTATSIYIWGHNACDTDTSGDGFYPGQRAPKGGGNYVDYKIIGRDKAVVLEKHGIYSTVESQCSGYLELKIPASAFQKDDATQLSYVKFTANVANGARGFVNRFSLSSGSDKIIIAPEGRESSNNDRGSAVMMEQNGSSPMWTRYSIRFGSDCTVPPAGKTATIGFYDLDNTLGGGPKSAQGDDYRLSMRLYSYPRGSSAPRLEVPMGTPPAIVLTPTGANNLPYSVSFFARPDLRYELQLDRVYFNNTIQFTLPFDGIHWNVPCNVKVDPTSTIVNPVLRLRSTGVYGSDSLSGTTVEEGDDIYVHSRINNTGSNTANIRYNRDVWWERGSNDSLDSTDLNINRIGWTNGTIAKGADLRIDPDSTPAVNRPADLSDGRQRFCSKLTVEPINSDTAKTTVSEAVTTRCVYVGKTPTFQAWGSDLRVGGSAALSAQFGIATSTKNSQGDNPLQYGSWSEYGAMASGPITGFGSGATLKAGVDSVESNSVKKLTFANTPTTGKFSSTAGIGELPRDYIKSHPAFNANLVYPNVPQGTITNTQIYRTTGNVTISNDIKYNPTVGNVDAMPQVVIIANNIYISPGVTNIDAWLIADNIIDTCFDTSAGVDTMNVNKCSKQLKINGPVMAKTLKLKRNYTGEPSDPKRKAVPAEIVNLRSDAYIWANNRYGKSGGATMRTSYISELPPRY